MDERIGARDGEGWSMKAKEERDGRKNAGLC